MHLRTFVLLGLVSGALHAQSPALNVPQIVTSASAEVDLKPDRAALTFTVESRGGTAARAGAETARKQRAVLDTLRAMGISADQMTTTSIEISPEYVYPGQNQPPRVSGYVARNSVRIDVLKIDKTGSLIDAGLSKEATGVGSLDFTSSKEAEARRQALELAVGKAKAEAESIARAAGVIIGPLIELIAQPQFVQPIYRNMAFKSAMASPSADVTPVNPGQLKISASVSGRWSFTPR
jgi:uncharacterized protein YggE